MREQIFLEAVSGSIDERKIQGILSILDGLEHVQFDHDTSSVIIEAKDDYNLGLAKRLLKEAGCEMRMTPTLR